MSNGLFAYKLVNKHRISGKPIMKQNENAIEWNGLRK